jgi:aspartyl-tRNA synthetase
MEETAANANPAVEDAATTSKKAAKKAEAKAKKEALKAQKAAERLATSTANLQIDDFAKDRYGKVTPESPATFSTEAQEVNLKTLGEEHDGKHVVLRAWLQNSRTQSAKMAFVELREEGNWWVKYAML